MEATPEKLVGRKLIKVRKPEYIYTSDGKVWNKSKKSLEGLDMSGSSSYILEEDRRQNTYKTNGEKW